MITAMISRVTASGQNINYLIRKAGKKFQNGQQKLRLSINRFFRDNTSFPNHRFGVVFAYLISAF